MAMVTDAYQKRCAITNEKTLPVLEAAHIKPYAEAGLTSSKNGLLLRSDMHFLFDKGYITITGDHHLEVSRRNREEFENGREYYAYQGKEVKNLLSQLIDQPSHEFLQWHKQEVYNG